VNAIFTAAPESPASPGTEPALAEPAHPPVPGPAGITPEAPESPQVFTLPAAAPAGVPAQPTAGAPTVFTRPPAAQPASRAGELWALVAAAGLGAFATLAGVAVGWTLARSTPRHR
jgi:hypothetical protein